MNQEAFIEHVAEGVRYQENTGSIIRYSRTKFTSRVDLTTATFERQVAFSDCVFEDDVQIYAAVFYDNVSFINCHFRGGNIGFDSSQAHKDLKYKSCVFHSEFKWFDSFVKGETHLHSCIFLKGSNLLGPNPRRDILSMEFEGGLFISA